jgi:predicted Zn-dependent protease
VAVIVSALLLAAGAAGAEPFVPSGDAVVLERLPERGDPALARLKRMRSALAAAPRDIDIAVPVARRALEAARSLGDPRFLGQAQAALAPWWTGTDVPPAALLLRATLKQSQHDFDGALADLDRLLAANPAAAQARLTRATVLGVMGRYAEARRDCAHLAGRTSPLVYAGCDAMPASLSGDSDGAYAALVRALADPREPAGLREWGFTLAAELAARRGDAEAAERHFADARVLDPRDAYVKGAYADYLLDRDRPTDVLPLLRDDTRNDALLLRLALAEQRLPDQRASFAAHREELAARFDAARRRGDSVHRREEARFRLAIENDAAAALALARYNWAVQREPADLRILIDAARAARDADALKIASDWVAAHRIADGVVAPRAPR